jgi:AmmeMemoRadiSam system protein A
MLLTDTQKTQLLELARKSIWHGLQQGRSLTIDLDTYREELRTKRATFVTLKKNSQLRGCIGVLEAIRPLVEDISHNSYAAAFKDFRFSPVTINEFEHLDIHLSLLTAPEPITFKSEQDLLSQIQPNIDGLILKEGHRRATFLPSVWQSLNNKQDFVGHLKVKAGLSAHYWSNQIQFFRYRTEIIE